MTYPSGFRFAAAAFWSIVYLAFVGAVGVLANLSAIRDDHRRTYLAAHGVRTVGIISGRKEAFDTGDAPARRNRRGCGKGAMAVVQFTPAKQNTRSACVEAGPGLPSEYLGYAWRTPPPKRTVGLVYDGKDASHFYILSSDGRMPRRNLDGLWGRWFKQTALLTAIFFVLALCRAWKRRRC